MSFSRRFKELREEKGVSQESLAKILKIPRASISNYEREGRIPREERLKLIADYFGVSIDYLLGRTDVETLDDGEQQFVKDINHMSIEELLAKYNITSDGKPVTEEEIKAAIALIRSLRNL